MVHWVYDSTVEGLEDCSAETLELSVSSSCCLAKNVVTVRVPVDPKVRIHPTAPKMGTLL